MEHNVIRQTLSNGISLVVIPLLGTEAVTTIVLMGVGSRFEADNQRGLAHFTEHMVFKGGRKFQTAQVVAQTLDAIGGEFNAFTSQEFTGFYTKTDGKHLQIGMDVLSDIVLHATFPEVELEKEKGVIVEEINMYEDIPMRKVDAVLSELVFGDTPLGRAILGTKDSVTGFTREDFVRYREQFYKGSQCTIVVAGAIDPEVVKAMAEEHFNEMPQGETYEPKEAIFHMGQERVQMEVKESQQTHLMLATKGLQLNHPSRYVYRVMSTILGGNMSSRLFLSVREEQGLCYYVRATPDLYKDTGMLVASAGVDNARLELAITAIVNEFRKLRDEPVSSEELNRAKQFLIGKMSLTLEDSEEVAEFYGMQDLLEKNIQSPAEIEARVLAVTIEEVQKVAQELFVDANLRLALVGPKQDVAMLDSLLHI